MYALKIIPHSNTLTSSDHDTRECENGYEISNSDSEDYQQHDESL